MKIYWIRKNNDINRFLTDNSIAWRPEGSFDERLIEFAGRLCYGSWEKDEGGFENKNISRVRSDREDYITNLIDQGHLSTFEHCGLVFVLQGVSRVLTHELVRHRHCGFSQESGRYVRRDHSIVLPDWLSELIKSEESLSDSFVAYANALKGLLTRLEDHLLTPELSFAEKKIVTSALRRFLPQGTDTTILFSTNHRNLRHMIKLRTDPSAEEEIKEAFDTIHAMVSKEYPLIYKGLE